MKDKSSVEDSLSLGRGAELVEAEMGFAEHNATCKRENSGPLSVALAGASSPRGEPRLPSLTLFVSVETAGACYFTFAFYFYASASSLFSVSSISL